MTDTDYAAMTFLLCLFLSIVGAAICQTVVVYVLINEKYAIKNNVFYYWMLYVNMSQ